MILDARTLDYSALIFRVIILMLGIALGGILVIKGKRKMGILQIIASISVPLLTSICCVYMKNVLKMNRMNISAGAEELTKKRGKRSLLQGIISNINILQGKDTAADTETRMRLISATNGFGRIGRKNPSSQRTIPPE